MRCYLILGSTIVEGGVLGRKAVNELSSAEAVNNLKIAIQGSSLGLTAPDGSLLTVISSSFRTYPAKGTISLFPMSVL